MFRQLIGLIGKKEECPKVHLLLVFCKVSMPECSVNSNVIQKNISFPFFVLVKKAAVVANVFKKTSIIIF